MHDDPPTASLTIRPDRLEQMWAMTPLERRRAAESGQLTLGEMLRWASRRPHEVDLVDGEFWFITAHMPEGGRRERGRRPGLLGGGVHAAA